jgi:hypothetical protein
MIGTAIKLLFARFLGRFIGGRAGMVVAALLLARSLAGRRSR